MDRWKSLCLHVGEIWFACDRRNWFAGRKGVNWLGVARLRLALAALETNAPGEIGCRRERVNWYGVEPRIWSLRSRARVARATKVTVFRRRLVQAIRCDRRPVAARVALGKSTSRISAIGVSSLPASCLRERVAQSTGDAPPPHTVSGRAACRCGGTGRHPIQICRCATIQFGLTSPRALRKHTREIDARWTLCRTIYGYSRGFDMDAQKRC